MTKKEFVDMINQDKNAGSYIDKTDINSNSNLKDPFKLNNNEYPIPDSALVALTVDFVTHLGTIAGSDMKVVVGGVEYGIDSSKVAGAVSALDTAFGELENPIIDGDVAVLDEATLDYVILA